jgi:hypothetical protein
MRQGNATPRTDVNARVAIAWQEPRARINCTAGWWRVGRSWRWHRPHRDTAVNGPSEGLPARVASARVLALLEPRARRARDERKNRTTTGCWHVGRSWRWHRPSSRYGRQRTERGAACPRRQRACTGSPRTPRENPPREVEYRAPDAPCMGPCVGARSALEEGLKKGRRSVFPLSSCHVSVFGVHVRFVRTAEVYPAKIAAK